MGVKGGIHSPKESRLEIITMYDLHMCMLTTRTESRNSISHRNILILKTEKTDEINVAISVHIKSHQPIILSFFSVLPAAVRQRKGFYFQTKVL